MPAVGSSWKSNRNYGAVIDAGSSGSRIQIYSWKDHRFVREQNDNLHALPNIELADELGEKWQYKVEPGISSFVEKPMDVGDHHLRQLLDFALEVVPQNKIVDTPVYLFATAGMRLLTNEQQKQILDSACAYIRTYYHFRLDKCKDRIKVISGKMEGVYGWLAVNYKLGGFTTDNVEHFTPHDVKDLSGANKHITTFGFLDMGGASAQIAFEPNSIEAQKHQKDLETVTLYTLDEKKLDYYVFVTTFLGFGTNEARRRYVEMRINSYNGTRTEIKNPGTAREQITTIIKDPCIPKNLLLTDTSRPPPYHAFQGTGSFRDCLEQTLPLLNKTVPCNDSPCLFNGVHAPNIDFSVNRFVGVSEYWYTADDVLKLGGEWNYEVFEEKAADYCSLYWDDILDKYPDIDIQRLEMQCFKSAWLVNFLHDGIGIPNDSDVDNVVGEDNPPFRSVKDINKIQVSWTLGMMVMEVSRSIPPPPPTHIITPPPDVKDSTFVFDNYFVMLIFLLVFFTSGVFFYLRKNGNVRRRMFSCLHACFSSPCRRDSSDYSIIDGGQSNSAPSWRILNTVKMMHIVMKVWINRFKPQFRPFSSKKGADSSEHVFGSGISGEDDIHLRPTDAGSAIQESQTSVGENVFQSRYPKKRLSGDSVAPGSPHEGIVEAEVLSASTPGPLSLNGLQSRNTSSTTINIMSGNSNNGNPGYSSTRARSTPSLLLGGVRKNDVNNDDNIIEYEASDSGQLDHVTHLASLLSYSSSTIPRAYNFPSTTSPRNSIQPVGGSGVGYHSNHSSVDMGSVGGITGFNRPNSRAGRTMNVDKNNKGLAKDLE
ncbi:1579_t:CDS:2 [Paraglomus brasilianum]|uniref:1579_t:CDS:1 n=1 Tax=Paraglomus brasilianum TaxID=144538 RepID=A0A9N8ZMM8_9GLOM|nr:1579_t:CDS:2 [Paraglomus brasilianum]